MTALWLWTEPSDWTTSTFSGSFASRSVAIGAPKPLGVKRIVWGSTLLHLPGTSGSRVGILPPRTFFTFFEKVSVSGVEGPISEPATGVAATVGGAAGREPGDVGELAEVLPAAGRGGDHEAAGRGLVAELHLVLGVLEGAVGELAGLAVGDLDDRLVEVDGRHAV